MSFEVDEHVFISLKDKRPHDLDVSCYQRRKKSGCRMQNGCCALQK
jgi:hypothetical protein